MTDFVTSVAQPGFLDARLRFVSRSSRLLHLVQALRRHRRPVTSNELALELEVSRRTILRDIETLRGQGASIDGEAGVGYQLRPGFLLPPLMFNVDELEAIVLGLRLVEHQGDNALENAAIDVIAKLRAVLPRDLRQLLDESGLIAGPPPKRPTAHVPTPRIRETIRLSHKAKIAYEDAHGMPSERVIWPLGLSFFDRLHIVIAWCELRDGFRCFRVDRIARWEHLRDRIPQSRLGLLAQWREQEGIEG